MGLVSHRLIVSRIGFSRLIFVGQAGVKAAFIMDCSKRRIEIVFPPIVGQIPFLEIEPIGMKHGIDLRSPLLYV